MSSRKSLLALTGTTLPAVFLALFGQSAVGQDLNLAELRELDDDNREIRYQELTIDDLENLDVVRNGEVIGEVESVLGDANGEVVALVIEYGGNVVGVGDREVVLSVDDVSFPEGRNEVEITLTDEELAELPVWDRD